MTACFCELLPNMSIKSAVAGVLFAKAFVDGFENDVGDICCFDAGVSIDFLLLEA